MRSTPAARSGGKVARVHRSAQQRGDPALSVEVGPLVGGDGAIVLRQRAEEAALVAEAEFFVRDAVDFRQDLADGSPFAGTAILGLYLRQGFEQQEPSAGELDDAGGYGDRGVDSGQAGQLLQAG
jgi:hypothetical protein